MIFASFSSLMGSRILLGQWKRTVLTRGGGGSCLPVLPPVQKSKKDRRIQTSVSRQS